MKRSRVTNQKVKIIEFLKHTHEHPTAEKVFENVRKDLPRVSLATVYRNLNILAESGEIFRFNVGNEYRYDSNKECHHHFVCTKCGVITDLCDKGIRSFILKNLETEQFDIRNVTVIAYGTCRRCRKQKNHVER